MAWAVRWRRCVSVPPSLAESTASEPLFSFSSSFFCSSKDLAAAERLGGRGGAEGGGGGCNWRLEPYYPSRCPHQPISILSLLFNPGDPLGRQGLWHVSEYGLCECEKVFHVAWASVWDYLLDLVLPLIWRQHQTVIFRLGMCCRQAIRPSCPSLALTAVFVCDMQMSPFFFFLFFGRRLAQGVGKGVCLLWLWNEPPYVKASAVVLASVLFTVTLSHLIRTMLIASKWFCFGALSSAPPPAVPHSCLKGHLVTHHPSDHFLPILLPIISTHILYLWWYQ